MATCTLDTPFSTDNPDVGRQKHIIRPLLNTPFKKGDLWYLVGVRWIMQWIKYVGYNTWDQSSVGRESAHPGPVDNSSIFLKVDDLPKEASQGSPVMLPEKGVINDEVLLFEVLKHYVTEVREHLQEALDYSLLPVQAWNQLVRWYGLTADSRPVPRVVVEYGMYMKHCQVEVYPLEFKLCVHPHLYDTTKLGFSRGHTVGFLERVIRALFNIREDVECRVWQRYMTHTYEPLSKPNQTLQDAGLFNGQLIVIMMKMVDCSWPKLPTSEADLDNISPPHAQRTYSEIMNVLRPLDVVRRLSNAQHTQQTDRESSQSLIVRLRQVEQSLGESRQQAEQVQSQLRETQQQLTQSRQETEQVQQQLAAARQEASQTRHQLEDAQQQASQAQQQVREAQQQADRQRRETQRLLAEAQQQATQAQQQAERQLRESQVLLTETQQQAREAQQQADEAHQRVDDMEHDLRDAENRISTSDRVFQDVLQRIMGHIPQSQPFWVVQRAEVNLTEEEIGTGGWASVKVAIFRGQRVAAKCLHEQIVSAHNIRLFTREMNMAAQARHPNLLQFVGAVMEGTPIILTELLPTSLRRIMEQGRRLSRPQVVSISCDVARALNYLHLSTPDPIVHRDLSSANVLLKPSGDRWEAKVSDYGSANFVRYATTAGPGNPLYGAPESNDPSRHSAKMDVFSFGVLLVEMVAGELPDKREELIRTRLNDWPELVRIVRLCTRREPQRRPDMTELITVLSGLNVE